MSIQLFLFLICFISSQATWAQSPDGPEAITVYLTQEQALQKAFPKADTIWAQVWTPTPAQRKKVERRLGWRLSESSFEIFQARKKEQHLGYAVVTEQIGLYKPITFMVKVDTEGKNDGVWIMVYRESRGAEVKRQRFLTQYKGKMPTSPIRLNR
ncbi:MAG: hypothetical protein HN521_09280, partial [Candidatus Latescibacteria bacterium]|nr:hypothetical protein [Candidatus Latescibacterota bacterium]